MKLSTLGHTFISLELGSSKCWVVWCTHMLLGCREDGRFQRLPGARGLAGDLTGKEARRPLSLVGTRVTAERECLQGRRVGPEPLKELWC